jgi:hypothetical protein
LLDEKNRTVGRSFRIEERWLNTLNDEAKNEGISPNALLNKILQDYCLFYRYLKRFPTVIVTQKSFSGLLKSCPKDDVLRCAKKAGSINAQDILHTLGFNLNHESVIYLLRDIYGRYGNWYTYNHHFRNGKEIFHLRHDLGENWSLFVSEVVSTLFECGLNQKVKKEFLESSVTIDVPLLPRT